MGVGKRDFQSIDDEGCARHQETRCYSRGHQCSLVNEEILKREHLFDEKVSSNSQPLPPQPKKNY